MSAIASATNVERAVRTRYAQAARAPEPSLCCPVSYDPALLAPIPREVLDRDYGCGDPTRHVRAGETVLDLGSGAGKACFLASQVVGPTGRVIGIDVNDEMLALARRNAPKVARCVGHGNVEFRKGRLQDLALDLERPGRVLVENDSVDVVISNCVLNLVASEEKRRLFHEIFRVLRRGGRAVISDIVSDEGVPEHLQRDPELWSGCISGALWEEAFLEGFEDAGLHGIEILERNEEPWRTVEGIEFRSVTVVAYKGDDGPCIDQKHAVIYRGPFRQVIDDDGHVLRRGVRTAVCEKTYRLYSRAPYREYVELVPPRALVPLADSPPFPCDAGALRRNPFETKGEGYRVTTDPGPAACSPRAGGGNGSCC